MKKKTKKKAAVPHRVLGKIKLEHLETIKQFEEIEPEPATQVTASDSDAAALNEADHLLIAVPKSAWDRFCDWFSKG